MLFGVVESERWATNKSRYPQAVERSSSEWSHKLWLIWLLPKPTADRPHGYKYRLNYSLPNGQSLVRYDTEAGKGNHKHLNDKEYAYNFNDLKQLLKDYRADIFKLGGVL